MWIINKGGFDVDYKRTEAAFAMFRIQLLYVMTHCVDVSSRASTHVYRVFQIDRVRCRIPC